MRVPIAWLRDYVDLPAEADPIVERVAALGFPVDAIERRPSITGVVIGRLSAVVKHPNADRLQVCTVDVGASKPLTIATAATNVAAGQTIPVATIGARLPQLTIAPRTMRGIASEGMLVSADELALDPSWFEDGILQLDDDLPLGADAIAALGLSDPVLDVDVTTNRVDALSIVGLARELAASFGVALREPPSDAPTTGESDDVRVTIESVDCRRYVMQRASGLQVRPAPSWMRLRLALAGQRPINNLVDISNFVMLELGQPLHFFDFEKIAGAHIVVRDARPGERLVTLDGVERALDATALLIADERAATGLAGLMGGQVSEVGPQTREVAIESACWTGPRIRRMSVALGLRTEASTRNEKGLPLWLSDRGAARAAHLLAREGATLRAPRGYGQRPTPPQPIAFPASEVTRLLGIPIDAAQASTALRSLGFAVEERGAQLAVTPPPWRGDVAIAADLVEEVARVVGYDRIEGTLPAIAAQPLSSAAFERDGELARTLAGLGYRECITLGLQPAALAERDRALGFAVPPVVEIRNPLSDDQRYLRYSMLHAHLAMIARDRLRPHRTFELGHVFSDAPDAPQEHHVATLVVATERLDEPVWRSTPFLALKSDVVALLRAVTGRTAEVERGRSLHLHPGKTGAIRLDGMVVGYVGVVDPRLLHAYEIVDDVVAAVLEVTALPGRRVAAYQPPSRFPAVERDIAVVLDAELPAADVLRVVRAQPDVRAADAFDEYRGPQIDVAKKSLALRILVGRDDATLTDAQADAAIDAIVGALRERFGAILRT